MKALKDKTRIATVGNVLKPGVANGVFIKDSDWISEETLEKVDSIRKLHEYITGILE